MNNIFIKPVITEKAMNSVGNNKYTFIVARNAKKDAIKKAIEKIFTVHFYFLFFGNIVYRGAFHDNISNTLLAFCNKDPFGSIPAYCVLPV